MSNKFMTEREAAEYLGLSPYTLARWRSHGQGPRAHRFGGAVRYSEADLEAFAHVSTQRPEAIQ